MAGQEQFVGSGRPFIWSAAGSLLRLLLVVAPLAAACLPAEPPRTAAPAAASPARPEEPGAIPARGKFVLVDVPSYELIAFQDGVPILRSRVIVGRPQTPTPALVSSMYAIKFNPDWTPTPEMMRTEGLRYMPPGPNNPLGRILFELDNDQLVYLHDTNQKELFNRAERAFSHGCVRVEQARPLAAWALGVPVEEIDSMIARRGTHSVPLPEAIPVSLAHQAQLPKGYDHGAMSPVVTPQRAAVDHPASEGMPRTQASLSAAGCPGART